MAVWDRTEKSILSLVRQLTEEAKTALKKELELGKAEISEHVAKYGRHAVIIATGALLAYGGLIVLLICLGILISWGLMRSGLDEMVAIFAGLGLVALLAIAVGMALALFFVKKLKALSPLPKKTVNEAKALTAAVTGKEPQLRAVTPPREIKQSSTEAQADVRRIRHDLSDTVEELKERLTKMAAGIKRQAKVLVKPFGYTQEMDELMAASDLALGKPGGLTTSEALAKDLVFVIVNPIPGQEERNSDHLLEAAAAIRCNNLPTLAYKLDRLLADRARFASMKANARALAHPNAARDIVQKLIKLS